MTQPSAALAKLVDKSNNPQIGDRQAAITAITDSSNGTQNGSTIDSTSLNYQDMADDTSTLAAKINEIIDALEAHGLIADN